MITSVSQFFEIFENFIYSMGIMPIIQGIFLLIAIVAGIHMIQELKGK